MAQFPVLPLWVQDFLADTRDLTTTEVGAYALMLFSAWLQADCMLPNDDRALQKICGLRGIHWMRSRIKLRGFWLVDNDTGKLYQKRLLSERAKAQNKRLAKQHAGALGGAATALKSKTAAPANAPANDEQTSSIAPPSLNLIPSPMLDIESVSVPPPRAHARAHARGNGTQSPQPKDTHTRDLKSDQPQETPYAKPSRRNVFTEEI